MAYQMTGLHCPNCGGSQFTEDQKNCLFCGGAVILASISDFSSIDMKKYENSYREQLKENPNSDALNMSLAMCYLKKKLYDRALPFFEKAMDDTFGEPETLFFASVCLLEGKKAFVTKRNNIDKIITYLKNAIEESNNSVYRAFLAYVKYDYFERKYLNISPNWQEEIQNGVSSADFAQLAEILQVEMPECLKV
jgi:tetratricopeptide (TPR) repeat protein